MILRASAVKRGIQNICFTVSIPIEYILEEPCTIVKELCIRLDPRWRKSRDYASSKRKAMLFLLREQLIRIYPRSEW
jgi:hypothetical protein